MSYLIIDFETHDPYFERGLGAGWVFKLNNTPNNDFEVLGCAYMKQGDTPEYTQDYVLLQHLIDSADYLVMHNAQYDLGCLYALGLNVKNKKVFDTMIMAKLNDSTKMSYSLDNLAKEYLKLTKSETYLANAVWKYDLYPLKKSEEKLLEKCLQKQQVFTREKPGEDKLIKFAKKNMKLIQEVSPRDMAEYAKGDVILTDRLFNYFKNYVDMDKAEWYSFFAHICIDYRRRGVRVDIAKAKQASIKFEEMLNNAEKDLFEYVGKEFNYNSIIELPQVFTDLQIPYPKTDKGNPSITSPWLKTIDHPIAEKLLKIKKVAKIKNDFVDKVLEMQEYTVGIPYNSLNYGRLFPELNILAANTGRFSSTSPNIQQIPKVDHDNPDAIANLVRELYLPEEGETWYSLDFSNQEGRLQIHYAYLLDCEGANLLKVEFDADPQTDMHQQVADLAKITRKEAKTINLGISYGMGRRKLAKALKLNDYKTSLLLKQYNDLVPYLQELNQHCMTALKTRGFIKTLNGRKVHLDRSDTEPDKDFSYKALNKLIQGSAADQTMIAMKTAYDEGIPILFPVHDELNFSAKDDSVATRMKQIMESGINLEIPMYTEIGKGKNWAEAK